MIKTKSVQGKDEDWKKPNQELFLPVHGYVYLSSAEMTVINHPAFQRLRRCRQLGLAHTVFPGGTHTRFEHSIGTVYTAQKIMTAIDWNFYRDDKDSNSKYILKTLSEPIQRFVRVAALLHDIGHLPFGHSLEDELAHLPPHDGKDRLKRVAEDLGADKIKWGKGLEAMRKSMKKPLNLRNLINHLYQDDLTLLYDKAGGSGSDARLEPFDVVNLIVSKIPKDEKGKKAWKAECNRLPSVFPLQVCRDMVGNTICADFLDYLHRDWYHLGRPLTEDQRIYQYMEIRTLEDKADDHSEWKFLINTGSPEKQRHDAFTTIIQLLDSRYKLSETVIFHRTKLAMIALLDRCLIEIRIFYQALDLKGKHADWDIYFETEFESLLLAGSDDELYGILKTLAEGGRNKTCRETVDRAIEGQEQAIRDSAEQDRAKSSKLLETKELELEPAGTESDDFGVKEQMDLILKLAKRMRDRVVYHEAANWRRNELKGHSDPEKNPTIKRISGWYKTPKSRGELLNLIEYKCDLEPGSVSMYVPADPRMNAKVAEVMVFIDDEPMKLNEYDETEEKSALTCGVVTAQRYRFFHLWSLRLYVEQEAWQNLGDDGQRKLAAILRGYSFFEGNDPDIHAQQMESLFPDVSQAARGGKIASASRPYILQEVKQLSNGIPIDLDDDNGTE